MSLPSPIANSLGYFLNFIINWSAQGAGVPQNPVVVDFGNQAYATTMQYVNGMIVDNTKGSDNLLITVSNSPVSYAIKAGQLAMLSIVAGANPKITIQNQSVAQPNLTGSTNLIFTTYTGLFNSSPTGNGTSSTNEYSGNSGLLTNVGLTPIEVWTTSPANWFILQNTGSEPLFFTFSASAFGLNLVLAPGAMLTSAQIGAIPKQPLYVACSAASPGQLAFEYQ